MVCLPLGRSPLRTACRVISLQLKSILLWATSPLPSCWLLKILHRLQPSTGAIALAMEKPPMSAIEFSPETRKLRKLRKPPSHLWVSGVTGVTGVGDCEKSGIRTMRVGRPPLGDDGTSLIASPLGNRWQSDSNSLASMP